MKLTDTACKNAKPRTAPYKLTDGGGLYLLVKPDGGKYWRMAYRFAGKQKTLYIGVYPAFTLVNARKHRDKTRELLAQVCDPSQTKRTEKIAARAAAASTFEAIAREFHAQQADTWSAKHASFWMRRMEREVFPYAGKLTLPELTAPILLEVLRRVEKRGSLYTAHTLRQCCGQVFRYGIQTGRCERNPATDLQGALKPYLVKHMAAVLEPVKAGELLRTFDGFTGQPTTRAALKLSALLFQRPGNIRAMEWNWVDLDEAMLTIPAQSMKRTIHGKVNGRPHLVPLAPQAAAVLKEVRALTGHGRYVFPCLRTGERPMSDNTLNAAMRRLGYDADEMTAHGFRAMARTLMVEQMPGIHPEFIEAQLAHGKSGPLGAAYDRAEFMAQRREMMTKWADYLDKLKTGT